MIRIAGSVSKGWLAKELGVAFERSYYFDPNQRHAVDRQCNDYVQQQLGDLGLVYTESNLGRREYHASDQVVVGGIQPNLIVGMLLGAEFRPADDADADISKECLAGADLTALPDPQTLLAQPLVAQFDQQIRSLRQAPAPGRRPIPPFFWDSSGRAAVHGAMTTGLKFLGDRFFLDMVTDPARCHQLVGWLTEVSVVLVTHFARSADLPITGMPVKWIQALGLLIEDGLENLWQRIGRNGKYVSVSERERSLS